MAIKKKNCVFLDRDGVINIDKGYISTISNFKMYPGIGRAINFINKKKYLVIIVTNQSGIGRGYYSIHDVEKLHYWLRDTLRKKSAHIDDIFYASFYANSKLKFTKKERLLRKPNIGMINKANKIWNIDMKNSYVVGDSIVDKNLACNAKLKYVNVNNSSDLLNIVKKICK